MPETKQKPRIALTMGDPAGVGPELCLAAISAPEILGRCHPHVFGDLSVLQACAERLRRPLPAELAISSFPEFLEGRVLHGPAIVDLRVISPDDFTPAEINAATGWAAYQYVERAVDAALAGRVDAITTAPLNKEAMHLAGVHFPGHTEILASRTHSEKFCMMQFSAELTCTFVTVHVGYHEVPGLLTEKRILDVLELTHDALLRIHGKAPKLVVCGLNPHAGEHGLFGQREEERIIMPAIAEAQRRGMNVEGPIPADTAFIPSKRRTTDAFVCMYHDQGHIPLKALAFDSAVNTTLGLPILRTSVDHGTALDIAWKGVADTGSLFSALRLAASLA